MFKTAFVMLGRAMSLGALVRAGAAGRPKGLRRPPTLRLRWILRVTGYRRSRAIGDFAWSFRQARMALENALLAFVGTILEVALAGANYRPDDLIRREFT